MGYYTTYSLTLRHATGEEFKLTGPEEIVLFNQIKEAINTVAKEEVFGTFNFAEFILANKYETKWYEYEKNMLAVSLEFPEILFELHCEGKYGNDWWINYFLNGKHQLCKAQTTYPPFDPAKLE